MPPYNPIRTNTNNQQGQTSSHPGADAAAEQRRRDEHARLENRLRIKKIEIKDREHRVATIEREVTHLEGEVHRTQGDIERLNIEFHQHESQSTREEKEARMSEGGIREKESELQRRSDEIAKLEREIDRLRIEVTEKERKIHDLKEESREFVKQKEVLRQKYELGHYASGNDGMHAHDDKLRLHHFQQEVMRKEAEIVRKKQESEQIKLDLRMRAQEVAQIETELRKS